MGHGCHDCGCPNGCECVCDRCQKRLGSCTCPKKCKHVGTDRMGLHALGGCEPCTAALNKLEPSGGFAYSPGMDPIEFDEYETSNLLWLMNVAQVIGLNSGDWFGQVKAKLANWSGALEGPNWGEQETEFALQMFAAKRMEPNLKGLGDRIAHLEKLLDMGIPMRLLCPACGQLHVDEGEFATKPHHTHACQLCGHVWRPAIVNTIGVQFLPGFKTS